MKHIHYIFCIALIIIFVSCAKTEENHEHHHHEASLQLTAYDSDYEVYAEIVPLSVEDASDISVHLTRLSDFKPEEEANVTVSMTVGDTETEAEAEESHTAGIYNFEIRPTETGEGTLTVHIQTGETNALFTFAIEVYGEEHQAAHEAEETHIHSSNGVEFTKEKSWTVDFATEAARIQPLSQTIRTVARVLPSIEQSRAIVALGSGMLTYAKAGLTDGSEVDAGESIFVIDGSNVADNNMVVRLEEARSNYEATRSEYERKRELFEQRLITRSDLVSAQNAFETAQTNYENLNRNFNGGRANVKAPISGYISCLELNNGQYVETGQTICQIVQSQTVYLKAELTPAQIRKLGRISGTIINGLDGTAYTLDDLQGNIVAVGQGASGTNPLVPVTFRVNNTIGLVPGAFAETFILGQEGQNTLIVPRSAILEEMGNYFVYVQLTPEYFEKREVGIGANDGRSVQINVGLREGERVVSRGAVLLKLAQSSGTLDAHSGHVH